MSKCILNSNKQNCDLDVCCFECRLNNDSMCKNLKDRCFTKDTYDESIIRGYPIVCKLYIIKE